MDDSINTSYFSVYNFAFLYVFDTMENNENVDFICMEIDDTQYRVIIICRHENILLEMCLCHTFYISNQV